MKAFKALIKPWGTTKKCENKNLIFSLRPGLGREELMSNRYSLMHLRIIGKRLNLTLMDLYSNLVRSLGTFFQNRVRQFLKFLLSHLCFLNSNHISEILFWVTPAKFHMTSFDHLPS